MTRMPHPGRRIVISATPGAGPGEYWSRIPYGLRKSIDPCTIPQGPFRIHGFHSLPCGETHSITELAASRPLRNAALTDGTPK